MTATALTHEESARDFAAAVRTHLADLPAAELDELLDGLQADLAERLAEGGELGDPQQYAEEMRQAAGLPERNEEEVVAKPGLRESLRQRRITLAQRLRDFWAATPARRALIEFFVSLRPLWWVVRGAVVAWLVLWVFGHPLVSGVPISGLGTLVCAAAVVVSVQWGRGRWASSTWLTFLRRAASAVAVVALVPCGAVLANALGSPSYVEAEPYHPYGLTQNGEPIGNVFAFDCAGQPLDGVQLFDQNGHPITTLAGDGASEPPLGWDDERQHNIRYERNQLAGYAGTWNVFPLQEARGMWDRDPETFTAKAAEWPEARTLPLSPECAAAVPEPSGSTSGAGTDSEPAGEQGAAGPTVADETPSDAVPGETPAPPAGDADETIEP